MFLLTNIPFCFIQALEGQSGCQIVPLIPSYETYNWVLWSFQGSASTWEDMQHRRLRAIGTTVNH